MATHPADTLPSGNSLKNRFQTPEKVQMYLPRETTTTTTTWKHRVISQVVNSSSLPRIGSAKSPRDWKPFVWLRFPIPCLQIYETKQRSDAKTWMTFTCWWFPSTPLKHMSQIGNLRGPRVKIKKSLKAPTSWILSMALIFEAPLPMFFFLRLKNHSLNFPQLKPPSLGSLHMAGAVWALAACDGEKFRPTNPV